MKHREKPEDFELSCDPHAAKLGEYAWLRTRLPSSSANFVGVLILLAACHARLIDIRAPLTSRIEKA
jgi:hypothetical protein